LGASLDTALEDCNQALRLDGDNDFIFDARGFVELRMGLLKDAIADYQLALQRNPKLPSALFGRGIAELRSGDAARGQADIAMAETVGPGTAKNFERYGVTP
jgi:tetratricopeptide (TPR) repeat protein